MKRTFVCASCIKQYVQPSYGSRGTPVVARMCVYTARKNLFNTTPIHSTHSPQLSSILLTCAKFKVWMTIVESGWNVWVWLLDVVSRRWVWVKSMGVATGCGCKEVYRFPDTNPYSYCICSFLQQHPYFLFIF